ncbi:MAG: hypothetical protein E7279_07915 [Lachnospiraceae bacterium]|nr:hypothetical protein [Lachnospiraceae bacterium]
MIRKGKITNIYDDGTYRVESIDIPGDISAPIKAQEGIDNEGTPLVKDDEVVYVIFDDQSGLILGRL